MDIIFGAESNGASNADFSCSEEFTCDEDGALTVESASGFGGVTLDPFDIGHFEEGFGIEGNDGDVGRCDAFYAEDLPADDGDFEGSDGAGRFDEGLTSEGVDFFGIDPGHVHDK